MLFAVLFPAGPAFGASKPHVIAFGKWTTIKWCAGANESKCLDVRMRPLYVDGRTRESVIDDDGEEEKAAQ